MNRSLLLLLLLTLTAPVVAAPPNVYDLDERLRKLEKQPQPQPGAADRQALVDMQLRLEQMQQEVQQLRGEVEQLTHQLQEVKGQQRDLYQDLDRRLLPLERAGTAAPAAPAAEEPAANNLPSEQEQADYQKGIALLKEIRYAPAAKAFDAYLKKYPQGRYAAIARYWLADSYYSDRKYAEAVTQFKLLLKEQPDSPKAAQAWLKIGYSQSELKQWAEARKTMEQVVKRYPGTTEATLATRQLDRLKQQGH